jgi:predicted secreted protein with PEFG-CTERM motif
MFKVLKIKLLLALLALSSITSLSPVFGQTSSGVITVTTDKTTYQDGSTIMISGKVSEQLNVPISIVIRDPSQHIVFIDQVNPIADTNGNISFTTQAVVGGSLWTSSGTYEIDVTYGNKSNTAKTMFEFTSSQMQVMNQTSANQKNPNQAIPEFGTLSGMIIVVSTMSVILVSRRFQF